MPTMEEWFRGLSPQQQEETVKAAQLLKKLHGHKDAYPLLKQAVKAADPNTSFTEDNIAAPYVARLDAIEKAVTDGFKAINDKEANAQITTQLAAVQGRHKFADKVMDEVKELMVKRGIADPEAAALLYEQEHPAPQPPRASAWEGSTVSIPDEVGEFKDWMLNPEAAADREIGRALDEIRTGNVLPGYV